MQVYSKSIYGKFLFRLRRPFQPYSSLDIILVNPSDQGLAAALIREASSISTSGFQATE